MFQARAIDSSRHRLQIAVASRVASLVTAAHW